MKSPVLRVLLALLPLVVGGIGGLVLNYLYPGVLVRFSSAPSLLALGSGLVLSALLVSSFLSARRNERRRSKSLADGATAARQEHLAFLSRLDHEMKNPLTAIRAGLAAHGTDDSPHLQVADTQVARLGSLVGDLRKLSDLQSRPLELEPVDLGETVGEAVAAVQTYLQQLGSKRSFAVHFPTAPWRIPPIMGDSDLLYLVVFNLLANAAKFTGDGDSVEVRAGETDRRVWLEVADTGLGIPEGDLPNIWAELARGANARGIAGTGLGLPLVKVVVERHGGKVSLRSREGQGTSVRVELPAGRIKGVAAAGTAPAAVKPVQPPQAAPAPAPAPAPPPPLAPLPPSAPLQSPASVPPPPPPPPTPVTQPIESASPNQPAEPGSSTQPGSPAQPAMSPEQIQPEPPIQPVVASPPAQSETSLELPPNRWFGRLPIVDGEVWVEAEVNLGGRTSQATTYLPADVVASPASVADALSVLGQLEAFDSAARTRLAWDLSQSNQVVVDYLDFHLSELPGSRAVIAATHAADPRAQLLAAAAFSGASFYQSPDGFLITLDYKVAPQDSDEILCVRFDRFGRFLRVAHES